jgi:hypothetical protein
MICAHAFGAGQVSKKQRVATLRALRTTKMPGSWEFGPANYWGFKEWVLWDPCDDDSAIQRHRFEHCHPQGSPIDPKQLADVLAKTDRSRRHRDGDRLQKIEVETERWNIILRAAILYRGSVGEQRAIAARAAIAELEAESQTLRNGNTYDPCRQLGETETLTGSAELSVSLSPSWRTETLTTGC